MSLEFQVFDPATCGFPRPRVSVLPHGYEPAGSDDAILMASAASLAGHGRYFSRGRYALGEAYRCAGLDSHGVLLAPAYHCVTMLDPALALGAEVQFYSLAPDLKPVMTALDEIIERSNKPVKALLATHFFGFVCDFSQLKHWCDTHAVVFIEDCSHTLFTERYQARGAGRYGQFVASSPYKFLPSADGGWLYSPDATALRNDDRCSTAWIDEVRGMKACLDASRQSRIGMADIAQLDGELAALVGRKLELGRDERHKRQTQSSQYRSAFAHKAALRSSRWLVNHYSVSFVISRRQANYRRWLQAIAHLPNCHPLYPELPEHVVPYMFPLYIDHPIPHFYLLKHLAVPVWRWDEMGVSECTVAQRYRLHLLHLPCHQSLSDHEMDWLAMAVSKILGMSAAGVKR